MIVKQLLGIDAEDHTLNNRNLQGEKLDNDDLSNILVSSLSAEKIKTMDRSDTNPQTASKLTEMMVKYHHPQSGTVTLNSRTETPVDMDKVEKNKVVQNALQSIKINNPDISPNDVGLQNKLREAAEADMKQSPKTVTAQAEIDKAVEVANKKEAEQKKAETALKDLSSAAKLATDNLNNLVNNPLKAVPNPISPSDMAASERYKQYEKDLQSARLRQVEVQNKIASAQAQLEIQKAQADAAKQQLADIKKSKTEPVNYFDTTKDGKLKDSSKIAWQNFIIPSIDVMANASGSSVGTKISRAQQLNPDIPSIINVVKQPQQKT